MLAQLLRTTLAIQYLFSALLAWGLGSTLNLGAAVCVMVALALPLVLSGLTVVYTCAVSNAGEGSATWWRSVWGELGAGTLIYLGRQIWAGRPPGVLMPTGSTTKGSSSGTVPVVLVHGFVCNHRIWDSLTPQLRAQGHAVVAVDLEPLFTSIDHYAAIVERAVAEAMHATGARQVALVGHSMGGLAIRAWLRAYGPSARDRTARVITLGTPHAGTQLAKMVHTPNSSQMGWNSDWLKELAASEDSELRAMFDIAITPQDNIVFPQRAQVLAGVTPKVFDGLGHLQLCTDPLVNGWVLHRLTEPRTST